ncbi:AbfB domain-containing protein [Actinoallomurus oryzae]|uniref:AbfB domain-containing protein n=1 Tax=Actinoallomurus oryzae TaxID=502180 RepID=UPI0031EE3509
MTSCGTRTSTSTGSRWTAPRCSAPTRRSAPQAGKSGQGTSFASYNYPTRFVRHYDNTLYIAGDGGDNAFDSATSWADDVSWAVGSPWAP